MDVTAVIVSGGDGLDRSILDDLPERRWVIAADSGLDVARAIGLQVDVVVGDLDSVSPEALAAHEGSVERHPPDKDATDLELALRLVMAQTHLEEVRVLGGHGGRFDHHLANAMLLCHPDFSTLTIEWLFDQTRVHVVWDHVELHGHKGDTISIIPIGSDAIGVTTEGLQWPLVEATLAVGSTRGVSNRMTKPVATVTVSDGPLLVIAEEAA